MKRLLVTAVALSLVLAGCRGQETPDTTQDTTAVTEQTEPSGFYAPDSNVEQQSGGAVLEYNLGGTHYRGISAIGDKLLLISGKEGTDLTVLSGIKGIPTASLSLGFDIYAAGAQAIYNGYVYYDAEQKQAVYLDSQLKEIRRVQLPQEAQGNPVFSGDGNEVFFCVDQQIRALEAERGLERLVKTQNCKSQKLLGCHFEDKLLLCSVEDEAGQWKTVYISAQTGQTLSVDQEMSSLFSYEDTYLAIRMDGTFQQNIFGSWEGKAQQLNVSGGNILPALELGGAVSYEVTEEGALGLHYYDLKSGKRTATAELSGVGTPQTLYADHWSGCLWILAGGGEGEPQRLLRWDVKKSAVVDEKAYAGPVYTAQTPDEAGLKACQDRVDQLNKKHGTTIRIWETAVKSHGGHTLVAEHQTSVINKTLDELEKVLDLFPENFLYKSVKGRIRICLVRSVDGDNLSAYYWFDGDPFIVLSAGMDIREEFTKSMGYVVDSHVLGNSPMYDYWETLNPKGFVYGDKTTYSKEYLEGEGRSFLDEASMESVTEERSRIFWQAVKEGNKELFQSPAMQKKLQMLCKAIRDAWRLERKTETYLWEQYLDEPIAYKK